MAVLFGTTTQNITIRIRTLYARGVLDPELTRRRILQSCMEGTREVRRHVYIYNTHVIVAIGRSTRGRLGEVFRRCCDGVNDDVDH